jgi:hypothetical protein
MQPHVFLSAFLVFVFQGFPLAPSAFAVASALAPRRWGTRRWRRRKGAAPFCRARAEVVWYYALQTALALSFRRGGPPTA